MKTIFFSLATLCAIWAGTQTIQMDSVSAQMPPFTGIVTPLTNQPAFTNTVVQVTTNLSALQLDDVVALLLNLQTNVEETLPALALIVSNATFVNFTAATQFRGAIAPITSNPASLVSPPAAAVQLPQASFSITMGTNTFDIDRPTLQALIQLRDDLQRTLPVLQALNGTTTPPPETTSQTPTSFLNPAVTSFIPGSLTNSSFTPPLTNQFQVF